MDLNVVSTVPSYLISEQTLGALGGAAVVAAAQAPEAAARPTPRNHLHLAPQLAAALHALLL